MAIASMSAAQIGVVTSSMRSPVLNKNIALAGLDVTHQPSAPRSNRQADGHSKRLPARVVAFAHYDSQKTRPRSTPVR
jgi:aminomethyltransferase